MKKLFLLLFIISTLATACSIDPPEGQLECTGDTDCPTSWMCDTDNLCYQSDEVDSTDEQTPQDSDSTDTAN